jgi:LysM repeat protein
MFDIAGVIGVTRDNKASLVILKPDGKSKIGMMTVHFNPDEYTVSRTLTWNKKDVPGKDVPNYDFGGAANADVTLNLLFDTTDQQSDVRNATKPIWEATFVDPSTKNATTQLGEPPRVMFMWGRQWSFTGVIVSMAQKFLLFKSDGTPLRVQVTLVLRQTKDDKTFGKQNPTSGAIPSKVHIVNDGDRLDLLANEYYGKPSMWRHIADYNGVDNPRDLVAGQHLIIPEVS